MVWFELRHPTGKVYGIGHGDTAGDLLVRHWGGQGRYSRRQATRDNGRITRIGLKIRNIVAEKVNHGYVVVRQGLGILPNEYGRQGEGVRVVPYTETRQVLDRMILRNEAEHYTQPPEAGAGASEPTTAHSAEDAYFYDANGHRLTHGDLVATPVGAGRLIAIIGDPGDEKWKVYVGSNTYMQYYSHELTFREARGSVGNRRFRENTRVYLITEVRDADGTRIPPNATGEVTMSLSNNAIRVTFDSPQSISGRQDYYLPNDFEQVSEATPPSPPRAEAHAPEPPPPLSSPAVIFQVGDVVELRDVVRLNASFMARVGDRATVTRSYTTSNHRRRMIDVRWERAVRGETRRENGIVASRFVLVQRLPEGAVSQVVQMVEQGAAYEPVAVDWTHRFTNADDFASRASLAEKVLYHVRNYPPGQGGMSLGELLIAFLGAAAGIPENSARREEITKTAGGLIVAGVLRSSSNHPVFPSPESRFFTSGDYVGRVDELLSFSALERARNNHGVAFHNAVQALDQAKAKLLELRTRAPSSPTLEQFQGVIDRLNTALQEDSIPVDAVGLTVTVVRQKTVNLNGLQRDAQRLRENIERVLGDLTAYEPVDLSRAEGVTHGVEDEMTYGLYDDQGELRRVLVPQEEGDLGSIFSTQYHGSMYHRAWADTIKRLAVRARVDSETVNKIEGLRTEIISATESNNYLRWEGDSTGLNPGGYSFEVVTRRTTDTVTNNMRRLQAGHEKLADVLTKTFKLIIKVIRKAKASEIQITSDWATFYNRYESVSKDGYSIKPVWGSQSSVGVGSNRSVNAVIVGSAHHSLGLEATSSDAKRKRAMLAVQYFEPFLIACFGAPTYQAEGSWRQATGRHYSVALSGDITNTQNGIVQWTRLLRQRYGLGQDYGYTTTSDKGSEIMHHGSNRTEYRFPDSIGPDGYVNLMKFLVLIHIYSSRLEVPLEDPKSKEYVHELMADAVVEGYDHHVSLIVINKWMDDNGLGGLREDGRVVVPRLLTSHPFDEVLEHVGKALWREYKTSAPYRKAFGRDTMPPTVHFNKPRQLGLLRSTRQVPGERYTYQSETSKMIYDVLHNALPNLRGAPSSQEVIQHLEGSFNLTRIRHRKYHDVLNVLASKGVLVKSFTPETQGHALRWPIATTLEAVKAGVEALKAEGYIVHRQTIEELTEDWYARVHAVQAEQPTEGAWTTQSPISLGIASAEEQATSAPAGSTGFQPDMLVELVSAVRGHSRGERARVVEVMERGGRESLRVRWQNTHRTTRGFIAGTRFRRVMPEEIRRVEELLVEPAGAPIFRNGDVVEFTEMVDEYPAGTRMVVTLQTANFVHGDVPTTNEANWTYNIEVRVGAVSLIIRPEVGDRVIGHSSMVPADRVGMAGTISSVSGYTVEVEWDDGRRSRESMARLRPTRIERPRTVQAEGDFHVGDRVVIMNIDGLGIRERDGEVVGGRYEGIRRGDTAIIEGIDEEGGLNVNWERSIRLDGMGLSARRFRPVPAVQQSASETTTGAGVGAERELSIGESVLVFEQDGVTQEHGVVIANPREREVGVLLRRTGGISVYPQDRIHPDPRHVVAVALQAGDHVVLLSEVEAVPAGNVGVLVDQEGRQGGWWVDFHDRSMAVRTADLVLGHRPSGGVAHGFTEGMVISLREPYGLIPMGTRARFISNASPSTIRLRWLEGPLDDSERIYRAVLFSRATPRQAEEEVPSIEERRVRPRQQASRAQQAGESLIVTLARYLQRLPANYQETPQGIRNGILRGIPVASRPPIERVRNELSKLVVLGLISSDRSGGGVFYHWSPSRNPPERQNYRRYREYILNAVRGV